MLSWNLFVWEDQNNIVSKLLEKEIVQQNWLLIENRDFSYTTEFEFFYEACTKLLSCTQRKEIQKKTKYLWITIYFGA